MRGRCLLFLAVLGGCRCDADAGAAATGSEPAKSAAATATATASLVDHARKTTSPQIELDNLEHRVRTAEERFAKNPDDLDRRRTLIGRYAQRIGYLGRMSDLDRVVELGEAATAKSATDAKALLTRAKARAVAHRFAEAERDLDDAAAHGADRVEADWARVSIWIAVGRYQRALEVVEPLEREHPNTDTISTLAVILGRLGRLEEADAKFVAAEHGYKGASPLGLAQIYFDRGSMWQAASDDDKARELFRAAVDRFPRYAHAVVHLAQLLPPDQAAPLLRELAATSEDPDVGGALGSVLELEAPGSGLEILGEARARYQSLYAKHPLAFADHAGWFFLKHGDDVGRALMAAQQNLENRQTAEAYELYITAALSAHADDQACGAAQIAQALAYSPPSLEALRVKATKRCAAEPSP
jgi:tetratricopeptide (TPR) repeat protein